MVQQYTNMSSSNWIAVYYTWGYYSVWPPECWWPPECRFHFGASLLKQEIYLVGKLIFTCCKIYCSL